MTRKSTESRQIERIRCEVRREQRYNKRVLRTRELTQLTREYLSGFDGGLRLALQIVSEQLRARK